MAKKITIQHLYTTSGTTAPIGLTEGEIAISHATGSEAIFLKNDKNNKEVKFIPKTKIDELISEATTGITSDLTTHETKSGTTGEIGHVKLVGGDLSSYTGNTISGEAAASHHTHGQYLKEENIISGTGIYVTNFGIPGIVSVNINDEYQNMISSGVTAYGWGNHADEDYAKNDDLKTLRNNISAHTNNKIVHITSDERTDWNKAKSDIDAFRAAAESGTTALDTLKEIQDFLTSDDGTVQTLLGNLSALTDTVSGNTDDITSLKDEFGNDGRVTLLEKDMLRRVETIETEANGNLSVTPGVTNNNDKKFTITHTSASTQTSEIKATNNTTGLSFGSEFEIVNKVGYDKNGHVVSGTTQTLKLPTIPTATTADYGIVKIQYGDLGIEKESINSPSGIAADVNHHHSQYAKSSDLGMTIDNGITIISCGTY